MNALSTFATFPAHELRPLPRSAVATRGKARVRERIVHDMPDDLSAAWADLTQAASEPNCFAEPWFAGPSLRHLACAEWMRLVEVWRGEGRGASLTGVMPLLVSPSYGRIPVASVQNWRHHHHFLGTPLVRAGEEQSFWAAILDHLDKAPWARNLLHIHSMAEDGAVHRGLAAAAGAIGRECAVVHRFTRAQLATNLSPQAYYEQSLRKKKRKELKRLENRLKELGEVVTRRLSGPRDLGPWCNEFLALEQSGWKGDAGSALGCDVMTERFFRETVAGAFAAGRLDFVRLDLDGRAIAMLVNFLAPPGGFSFKIAFDEAYARFSPGVLIQIENLQVLARGDIDWMDSCAVENHSMIDSLWEERRTIVRVSVPLGGLRRRLIYRACRTMEKAAAWRRGASRNEKKGE